MDDSMIERVARADRDTDRTAIASITKALRERGHEILAIQLWLAARYPESGALRKMIERSIDGLKP